MPRPSAADLADYRKKRDPLTTNEPFSAEHPASARGGTTSGDFVVHLHAATRRHFDLRLQIGGRLLSFAIPRGPTLVVAEKRLAVQTEDHPLEYLDFEAVIPENNYGAGAMIVWDMGRVQYLEQNAEASLAAGKIDFLLFGRKLMGRFALVETGKRQKPAPKQRQWLLLKKQDAFAEPEGEITEALPRSILSGLEVDELPRKQEIAAEWMEAARRAGAPERTVDATRLTPMLCATEGGSLKRAGWLYELKVDGVRIIADKAGDQVTLRYRTGRAVNHSYPEVVRAVRALPAERLVLDGEIVAFDERGKPSFQRLAPRIHAMRPLDTKLAQAEVPVVYLIFDLLALGPFNVGALALTERKALLDRVIQGKGILRRLDYLEGDGQALFDWCQAQGLEGVVAKHASSSYEPGPARSGDWVKIKCQRLDDFVIVGFTEGTGSRAALGALEVASYHGDELVYRGRVGSGLDSKLLRQLGVDLASREVPAPLFVGVPAPDSSVRHFVRPELVATVAYSSWTDDHRLRHPVFHGLRADVEPRACRAAPADQWIEQEMTAAAVESTAAEREVVPRAGQRSRVKLSNLNKVFWPEQGYTKGDLLRYYEEVSPVILPHLADRPVMLVRYPDGIAGKSFYQWNVPEGTPDWIRVLELRDQERDGRQVDTFLVDSVETLLHVINLGVIPLHVLASRKQTLENCDFVTLDLDPGPSPFTEIVKLALSLKQILDEIGLPGYVKTSGQAGMHVFVPVGPKIPFDTAKMIVELLGRLLQARNPETSTMERRVSERGRRVYIDTGQTGRSRTIVAPYSVRAAPGATVSTPLHWDEVHLAMNPYAYDIQSVPARIREYGDPMRGLLDEAPDVLGAMSALQRLFGV